MLKVLLPLYLLLINFASDFFLPPSDLSSRSSNTMTGFLAAFAFLYVIAEMLPKGNEPERRARLHPSLGSALPLNPLELTRFLCFAFHLQLSSLPESIRSSSSL
jgi:hypothetical protein